MKENYRNRGAADSGPSEKISRSRLNFRSSDDFAGETFLLKSGGHFPFVEISRHFKRLGALHRRVLFRAGHCFNSAIDGFNAFSAAQMQA